jgi:hypothetical protein
VRARNLKPSLFKNEVLGLADPLFTVVYEGLWCLADREGRLEDRPARIHIELNGLRTFDGTARALEWLADKGFIVRYRVGRANYIQVTTFAQHNRPHPNEPPTKIPPPPASSTRDSEPELVLILGTKQ